MLDIQKVLTDHKLWLEGNKEGSRANLSGAVLPPFQLPEGSLVGWKRFTWEGVRYIVKLRIGDDVRRTATPIGRKCRAESALVVEVFPPGAPVSDGSESGEAYTPVTYAVGEVVRGHDYCDDIREECRPGVHFFLTRAEAEAY